MTKLLDVPVQVYCNLYLAISSISSSICLAQHPTAPRQLVPHRKVVLMSPKIEK